MRKAVWVGKRKESRDEGGREDWTVRIDNDVRVIYHQRNKKLLSKIAFWPSKVQHKFSRG